MYCTYTGRSRSVVGVGASRAVHARRELNQRSGACASPAVSVTPSHVALLTAVRPPQVRAVAGVRSVLRAEPYVVRPV